MKIKYMLIGLAGICLIILSLMSIAIIPFSSYKKAEKIEGNYYHLYVLATQLEAHKDSFGTYPSENEGFKAFINWTAYGEGWNLDAWKTPLKYRLIDGKPVIISAGPDKIFDTTDDMKIEMKWLKPSFLQRLDCIPTKARRITCASNLKQIGLAIHMYSQDNKGQYPDKNGAEGLEMLRAGGYLKNVKFYTCPSTITIAKDGEKLTEENVDYVYIGGYNDSTSPDIAIAYDKPTNNHCKYGNILSVDGFAGGYAGANWMDYIKK